MGAKQTKEDETPTSPKSPRVSPVDHASGETAESVPALLDKHRARTTEKTITALKTELAEMRKTQQEILAKLQTLIDKK